MNVLSFNCLKFITKKAHLLCPPRSTSDFYDTQFGTLVSRNKHRSLFFPSQWFFHGNFINLLGQTKSLFRNFGFHHQICVSYFTQISGGLEKSLCTILVANNRRNNQNLCSLHCVDSNRPTANRVKYVSQLDFFVNALFLAWYLFWMVVSCQTIQL